MSEEQIRKLKSIAADLTGMDEAFDDMVSAFVLHGEILEVSDLIHMRQNFERVTNAIAGALGRKQG